MAERFNDPWSQGRKGIDILADILQYTDPTTVSNIMKNLQTQMPQVVSELRRRLLVFEDLGHIDPRGVQKLLKRITMRDLALSLKGAPDSVLQNLGTNMSQHMIQDLRDEISAIGPRPAAEIEAARARILGIVRDLITHRELYIDRSSPATSRTVI